MNQERHVLGEKEVETVKDTIYWGKVVGRDLLNLLTKKDFLTDEITNFGAICFDVFFGTEVEALRSVNPKRLIVTEPYSTPFGMYNGASMLNKEGIIREVGKGLNIELYMNQMYIALEKIKESKIPAVGLITWLNISPTYLSDSSMGMANIRHYLKEARELITDSGRIVFTISEPWWGRFFEQIASEGVEGLSLETMEIPEASSLLGRHCLIAKRATVLEK